MDNYFFYIEHALKLHKQWNMFSSSNYWPPNNILGILLFIAAIDL